MTTHSLEFLELPKSRSLEKPRDQGLTMMVDMGLPQGKLEDLLETAGNYLDVAKFIGSSARIYPEKIWRAKVDLYRKHQINPIFGGQFGETVFFRDGTEKVIEYFSRIFDLGITAVEISDTYDFVPFEERLKMIKAARKIGLNVRGEVGAKEALGDADALIKEAKACLDEGCTSVTVEAGELVVPSGLNKTLFDALSNTLKPDQLMFELPGPWIPGTTISDIFGLMKELVKVGGADINVGNVMSDNVFVLEMIRCGLTGTPRHPD